MEVPFDLDAARLNAVLDAVSDGISVFDAAGNLVLLNEAQARINGFATRQEMMRNLEFFARTYELSWPDGRGLLPVSDWPVSRALRGESFQEWELAGRRLDTGRQWLFRFSAEAVRDAEGKVTLAVVVTRDVTASGQLAQALHEAQQRHAAIFEHAPFGISLSDPVNLDLVSVNDAFCRLFECTREQALGKSSVMSAILEGSSRQKVIEALQSAGVVRDLAVERKTLTGRPRTLLINVDKLSIDGKPMLLTTIKDITLRRQAQLAVEESEARYRAIFNQAAMGVVLVETATGRMLEPNNRFCELVGYSRDELRELDWQALTHPDDLARNEAGVTQMTQSKAPYRSEKRYLRKDGSVVWVRLTVSPVSLPGEATQATQISLVEDITEQRLVAEQLRQAQKLESIGQLAGGVAHDFNNLLTVILSCSEVLREDVAEGRTPQLDDIKEISLAGQRARDLTRQLLAFSRRQVIAPVALDLNKVVHNSQSMLRRLVGEHVEVRAHLAGDLWTLWADAGHLDQVLMNLAVNARDAMPRGGVLSFATDNLTLTNPPGDWVRLKAVDSGTGMTPEVMAHLFEPFFTTKGPGKGTGLGLATVYGIVTHAGGLIRVQSALGQGTTFELLFPRSSKDVAPSTPAEARARTGTEVVLLVEDDPHVRDVTTRALAAAGYSLRSCPHPQAALDLTTESLEQVQLLITDVVMPGFDGRALANQLSARHPGLKVLFVSGYTHETIAERGVADSGLNFLAKPFTPASLLRRVRMVLDAPSG